MTPIERALRAKTATDWRDCACGYCQFYVASECRQSPPQRVSGPSEAYPQMDPWFRACAQFARARSELEEDKA